MKKSLKLMILFLSLSILSCSIDRDEISVITGIDGRTSLVKNTEEGEGPNCENGGVRIDFGLDLNFNEYLDDSEISSTSYVCNGLDGQDGQTSLIEVIPVDGNQECENGGVRINIGFDLNGNGELDDSEITYTTLICNGENGTDGTNGQDGTNGINTLVTTDLIPEGPICEEGGFQFNSGLDLNGNEILDDSEITNSNVICNGEDGLSVAYTTTDVGPTSACPTGGVIIETGLDLNENNILDSNEVTLTNFICNGLDGIDGTNGLNSLISTTQITGGVIISTGLDVNGNNILDDSEIMSTATVMNGTNGTNGLNSLISLADLPISQNFPTGGVSISTGLDLNGNNILDDNEITNISFISNGVNGTDGTNGQNGNDGQNGLNSLINILEDTPNSTSTTIETGIDLNGNNILDSNEVTSSTIIEDGDDGTNGQNGQNGLCSFIVVVDEPAGVNCEFGGIKVTTGKDLNGNLIFDDNEIQFTEYVCEYRPCVTLEDIDYVYGFEEYSAGDIVSLYDIIGVYGYRSNFNGNQFMIFDSNNPTGGDFDLATNTGNIGIISEDNDSNDPDDNAAGGVMRFNFNKPVTFTSLDMIDVGGQHNYVKLIDKFGTVTEVEIPITSNEPNNLITMTFNIPDIVRVVIEICESAAVDNLSFQCTTIINDCD